MPLVRILREDWADPDVPLPSYESSGAAGADVRANLAAEMRDSGLSLAPGARALVPTGIRIEIPDGYEVQVRPRSGLALKHGISLVNAPGTIDSDYRGPLGLIVINHGATQFTVSHGERIAQLVIAPVAQADFVASTSLDETERGESGFGSTGST